MKKRSLVGVAALTLLMSLTMTACGDDDDCDDESRGTEFAPMAMVQGTPKPKLNPPVKQQTKPSPPAKPNGGGVRIDFDDCD